MIMFKKLWTYIQSAFKKKCCENCMYCTLLYTTKPLYTHYTHVYKRSKKKKLKRHLVGFSKYTSVDCTCPDTQDKWAPYLKDIDYLMMEKPFKCMYWKGATK